MRPGLAPWHRRCAACGYESAALAPSINDPALHAQLDEQGREQALGALRRSNFAALLQRLSALGRPAGGALLDVGAAHGWFLQQAAGRFEVLGIEPDQAMQLRCAAAGLPVRAGYFPQVLDAGERFGVIVFNDVFEHLPDPPAALAACRHHLLPGGLLVLNLPSSRGPFYRAARLLRRLGIGGPFDRLWQKGMPSPHLHYFDPGNLSRLAAAAGFEPAYSGELPALRWRGLYARVAYAAPGAHLRNALAWLAAALAWPLLRAFPSDIALVIMRRPVRPQDHR